MRLSEKITYKNWGKRYYSFFSAIVFFLSFTVGIVFASETGRIASPEDIERFFFPRLFVFPLDTLTALSRSFYDDITEAVYIFALGFMTFGKLLSFGAVLFRGARAGVLVFELYAANAADMPLPFRERIAFLTVSLIVDAVIILFVGEACAFNTRLRNTFKNKLEVIKTRTFIGFVADMMIACGVIAVCRIVYTLIASL